MKTSLLRILGLNFILSLTLFGCSTVKSPFQSSTASSAPTPVLTKAEKERIDNIQSWHVSGKVAVQTSRDAGTASVDWVQRQDHFAISLIGPLGSHRMLLTGQPGYVNLATGDGKRANASSPEELLARQWGFRLPVSSMRYWIRGLAVPGIPAQTQYDASHRLARLVQQNWDVQYLGYTRSGSVSLPQKMAISSPQLRVKIIIYQWQAA